MAMKIIIGKFGEDGEPVWFDVETNEWKDENGNWKDVSNEDAGKEVIITKIKGGTGKPDESREDKVQGGNRRRVYC